MDTIIDVLTFVQYAINAPDMQAVDFAATGFVQAVKRDPADAKKPWRQRPLDIPIGPDAWTMTQENEHEALSRFATWAGPHIAMRWPDGPYSLVPVPTHRCVLNKHCTDGQQDARYDLASALASVGGDKYSVAHVLRWLEDTGSSRHGGTRVQTLFEATEKQAGLPADDIPEAIWQAILKMRSNMAQENDKESFIKRYIKSLNGITVNGKTIRLNKDEISRMYNAIKHGFADP